MRGLSFGELLDYSAEESNHWRDFFTQHPDALDLPCDIAQAKTVRELVLHIVIVQIRYAERLLNMPITEYESLAARFAQGKPGQGKSEELFALSRKSLEDLRSFAIAANDSDWDGTLTFPTRSAGELTASRRKIFIHALLHGVRHWAQLSTYLRQKGY
ncbi:MAG TPA: DinB family protein, partial [Candidatus Angelobacter sp.]